MGVLLIASQLIDTYDSVLDFFNYLPFIYKHNLRCAKSSTFKPVNVVTKSVPNSGKLFPTNMVSTQLVLIMVILIFNWKESTSTIMKPLAVNMCQELSS